MGPRITTDRYGITKPRITTDHCGITKPRIATDYRGSQSHRSPGPLTPRLQKRWRAVAAAASVALTVAAAGMLAAGAIPARNLGKDRLAVKGYDVVAYFTEGQARRGDARFETEWDGAIWRFATADHLELFRKDPARYAPQYGGYCAYAVSRNYTADADPEAWHIENGRLYLNYSKRVRETWRKDIPGNISKADRNWPGLKGTS